MKYRTRHFLVFLTSVAILVGVSLAAIPNNTLRNNYLVIPTINVTTAYQLSGNDVTDILEYPQQPASYIIWTEGGTYYAKNGTTGNIDFSGIDADRVVDWSLGNGTGIVQLLDGVFNFDSGITVGQNDELRGSGNQTTINYDSGGNCIILGGNNAKISNLRIVITIGAGGAGTRPNGIYSNGYNYIGIENVIVKGDQSVGSDGSNIRQCGVYVINSDYYKVKNCVIKDFYYTGINLYQGNTNGEISNNQIINCLQYGIWAYNNSNYNRVNNNYVNGCRTGINIRDSYHNTINSNICEENNGTVHGVYGYGILIFGLSKNNTITANIVNKNQMGICVDETATRGNTVVGNIADNNHRHGIYLYKSHYNTITGNSARHNGEYGILINNDSKYNTITGNTVTHNSLDGIRLDNNANTNNIIANNICNNNTQQGIRIYTSTKNTVTGNTAKFNTGNGIYLQTTSDENVLSGNICTDNVESGIYISGSDHNTVTGNTANGNEKYGLALVATSHNNLITGNTFSFNDKSDTNTYSGIILINSDNNTIQSNSLKYNDKYGIDVNGATCDNTVIKINTFFGNGAGIINNAGTGTITKENEGYTELGDIQTNAGNLEMYNGTAWVIIGP